MQHHRMVSVHMTHASRDGAGMACTVLSSGRPFRPARILNFSHLIIIVLTFELVSHFALVSCSGFFTLGFFLPFQFPHSVLGLASPTRSVCITFPSFHLLHPFSIFLPLPLLSSHMLFCLRLVSGPTQKVVLECSVSRALPVSPSAPSRSSGAFGVA